MSMNAGVLSIRYLIRSLWRTVLHEQAIYFTRTMNAHNQGLFDVCCPAGTCGKTDGGWYFTLEALPDKGERI
jgi:hypothetical protein